MLLDSAPIAFSRSVPPNDPLPFVDLFLSNTALPSLIMLLKWDPNSKAITQPGYIEKLMELFGRLVKKSPKKVLSLGISITIFSLIGLFLITVEVQYTKMFKKGNIIRDSAEFLDENLMGNVNVILRATSNEGEESLKTPKNLKDIEKIQNYLDSINYVTSTISVIDVVKQLHKTIMDENQDYYTIPDSLQQINNLFRWHQKYMKIKGSNKVLPFTSDLQLK